MWAGREKAERGVCSQAQQGREELEVPVGSTSMRKLHACYMFLYPGEDLTDHHPGI